MKITKKPIKADEELYIDDMPEEPIAAPAPEVPEVPEVDQKLDCFNQAGDALQKAIDALVEAASYCDEEEAAVVREQIKDIGTTLVDLRASAAQ